MQWRTRILAILATVVSLFSVSARADALYAATGSNGTAGNLWIVSPASGSAASVGPITIAGVPTPITGLAVHPYTKVLYGIVSNNAVANARGLVTIDKTNGVATLIGIMPNPGSDIAFGPNGLLYVWQQQQNRLGVINLNNAGVTPLGASGLAGTTGGGLAVNFAGVPIVSVTGANGGTLDTINTNTGAGTTGVLMAGAPQNFSMNAMAFDSKWNLYAINSNGAGVAQDNLVTINLLTGAVTNLGTLPTDIDALAFDPGNAGIPTLSEWAMIVMALLLAATGFVAMRRRG